MITKEMERLYRLCHHDFDGMAYADAAKIMGVSVRTVYRLLGEMRKQAPQLFPILNPEQAVIWRAWSRMGLSCKEIADIFFYSGLTEDAINSKLIIIRRKLGISEPHKRVVVRMPSSQMDELREDEVREVY